MIARADIVERVREWGLDEAVIEKDYVLGWLLWGVGSDPVLGHHWIFKGGTCLKWENMLRHQLPALLPLEPFLQELPALFGWLEGTVEAIDLPSIAYEPGEDQTWSPPPTVWTWGTGVALETVRFAAANHLCVDLTYRGSSRVIEPYSLRRSRQGFLLLHADRVDATGNRHRAYRVDSIEAIRVTTRPFQPRYPIEFSAKGPLYAPAQRSSRRRGSVGVERS